MVAHGGPEFQLDARGPGRTVADGERAFAPEKLDEHIVAHDPLVVLAQMGEEILGGRVRGLIIQQAIAGLALHVRLAGE